MWTKRRPRELPFAAEPGEKLDPGRPIVERARHFLVRGAEEAALHMPRRVGETTLCGCSNDPHNLFPAGGEVNGDRSAHPYGTVEG